MSITQRLTPETLGEWHKTVSKLVAWRPPAELEPTELSELPKAQGVQKKVGSKGSEAELSELPKPQGVQTKVGDNPLPIQSNLIFPGVIATPTQAPKRIPARRAPSRKNYPKPVRNKHGQIQLNEDGTPRIQDFASAVFGFACTIAIDTLNKRWHVDGFVVLPTLDEFEVELRETLYSRIGHHNEYDGPAPRGALSTGKLERIAAEAAEFALDVFDPGFFSEAARRGRYGGQKSRRGPKFTQAQLHTVSGLSKADAARALGCSTSTISNLRRAAAKSRS